MGFFNKEFKKAEPKIKEQPVEIPVPIGIRPVQSVVSQPIVQPQASMQQFQPFQLMPQQFQQPQQQQFQPYQYDFPMQSFQQMPQQQMSEKQMIKAQLGKVQEEVANIKTRLSYVEEALKILDKFLSI